MIWQDLVEGLSSSKIPCKIACGSELIILESRDCFDTLLFYTFQISIVSQEPVLFNFSVEENIAYGFNGNASSTEIETVAVSFNHFVFIPSEQMNIFYFYLLYFLYTDKVINISENG